MGISAPDGPPPLKQPETEERSAADSFYDHEMRPIIKGPSALGIFHFLEFNLDGIDDEENFVFSTSIVEPVINGELTASRYRYHLNTCAPHFGGTASVTCDYQNEENRSGIPHKLCEFVLKIKVPKDKVMKFAETMA